MRRAATIMAAILLSGAMFYSGGVQLSYFNIQPEGQDFVVSWQADSEVQVREYQLMRRTRLSNDQFVRVFATAAHGIGKAYTFRDTQVYKSGSDQLDYQLEVVYTTGVRELIHTQSINYTSTATRRTWGSLKAMFQ